jgi:hypothetical protein
MKKLKERNFIEFESATTGAGIDARSLTHGYQLITTKQPHFHGSVRVTPVVLKIDISNEPVGQEFLIISEMTYWNAFTGEDADWAAMHRVQNDGALPGGETGEVIRPSPVQARYATRTISGKAQVLRERQQIGLVLGARGSEA